MFQKTKTIKINNLHKDFKGKLDILQTFYVKCLAYAGNPLTPHQILKKVGDKNKINQTFDFLLFPLYTDPSNVQRVDHIQFVSEALKSIENMRLIKSEIYEIVRGDSTFCNRFQQEGEYTFVIKDNPKFKIIIPKTSFMPKYSGLEIKSFEKGTKNQESLKYSPIISETPGSAPSEVEISISTKNKRKNILYNTYLEIFGKDKD